jgi:hypothetical protein
MLNAVKDDPAVRLGLGSHECEMPVFLGGRSGSERASAPAVQGGSEVMNLRGASHAVSLIKLLFQRRFVRIGNL